MPVTTTQGPGTVVVLFITFIAGLVTRTVFTRPVELVEYQPIITREFVSMIETTTTTIFSQLPPPTTLSSSFPTSTVRITIFPDPKPGDVMPYVARFKESTSASRSEGGGFLAALLPKFVQWMIVLLEGFSIFYQFWTGRFSLSTLFPARSVVVPQREIAVQTEPDLEHHETIQTLKSQLHDLKVCLVHLRGDNILLRSQAWSTSVKLGNSTDKVARLEKEIGIIRKAADEESERHDELMSCAQKLQIKKNTEYASGVAAKDQELLELKNQHNTELQNLKEELQKSQASCTDLQANFLTQYSGLQKEYTEAISHARDELPQQYAERIYKLDSSVVKSRKDLTALQKQTAFQIGKLKEQHAKEIGALSIQLAEKQESYEKLQNYWVDEVAEMNEEHEKETNDLEGQLKKSKTENESLKKDTKGLYEQFDELEAEHSESKDYAQRLQTNIDGLNSENRNLRAQIKAIEAEAKDRIELIHSLQAKVTIRESTPRKRKHRAQLNSESSSPTRPCSMLKSVTNAETGFTKEEASVTTEFQHPPGLDCNENAKFLEATADEANVPKGPTVGCEDGQKETADEINISREPIKGDEERVLVNEIDTSRESTNRDKAGESMVTTNAPEQSMMGVSEKAPADEKETSS